MKHLLRDRLAIILQEAVGKLGFIPDQHGAWIKKDLKSGDDVLIPALGCYLEDCINEGSYNALDKAFEAREKHLKRKGGYG